MRIIEYEGVRHEFPDDFTDAEISAALAPAPVPDAPGRPRQGTPTRDPGGDLRRLGGLFLDGVYSGLASTAELPYDVVNNAPRIAAMISNPGPYLAGEQELPGRISDMAQGTALGHLFGSADPLQEGARSLGLTDTVEPTGTDERSLRAVGAGLGASIIPQGLLTAQASRLPQAWGAAAEMSPLTRAFALPYRDTPLRTNLVEAAAAAAGGGGAQVGLEATGGNPAGELLGGLMGGGAVALGANSATQLRNASADLLGDRAARLGAAKILTDNADDPGRLMTSFPTDQAAQMAADLPGVRATTAQATGDAGLRALQDTRATTGRNASQFGRRSRETADAVTSAVEALSPQAADPDAARTYFGQRRSAVLDRAAAGTERRSAAAASAAQDEATVRAEADQARAALDDMAADVTGEATARRVAGAQDLAAGVRDVRDNLRSARAEAYANIGDTEIPATPFQQEAQAIISEIRPLADTTRDPTLAVLLRDLEALAPDAGKQVSSSILGPDGRPVTRIAPEGSLTVRELVDLQPRLSRALTRSAGMMRGDVTAAAGRLDRAMKGALIELADKGDPAARQWRDANALSAEEAALFRRGAGGRFDQQIRRRTDDYDSAVASAYLRPDSSAGAAERAAQFEATVAKSDSPDAIRAAARDYIVGSLGETLGRRTRPDPRVIDQFMQRNSMILDRSPEAREELVQLRNRLQSGVDTVSQLEQDIVAASGRTRAAEASVEASKRRENRLGKALTGTQSTVGRYLSRDNAAEALRAVIDDKVRRRENVEQLMRTARRDPAAVENLRQGFFDLAREGVDENPLQHAQKFVRFMNRHDDIADVVLGKDAESYRKLASQLQALAPGDTAKRTVRGERSLNREIESGVRFNSTLSRVFAAESGRTSPRFVVSELAARAVNAFVQRVRQDGINNVLDQALLDPELARMLTIELSAENDRTLTKTLPAVLERMAARTARSTLATDDPERPAD